MAKTKPTQARRAKKKDRSKTIDNNASPESLLAEATALLQTSEPAPALVKARKALAKLQPDPLNPSVAALPAVNLLGEISVELGDIDIAREYFELAATLDPDGTLPESAGGGSDKFMWLAQLSEDGGHDSVSWFEKGADALRQDIAALDATKDPVAVQNRTRRLAAALCSTAEVYMTDLSWEAEAESRCEALIAEAILVAPDDPPTLQTLANIRISQGRVDDAQKHLSQSLDLWRELEPQHPDIPDFPTRISLARLLMEAAMENDALSVLERLIAEDESSVEAWYLGGWCLKLLADKRQDDDHLVLLRSCRSWLRTSLRFFQQQDYEDHRLREHAEEVLSELVPILGEPTEEDEDDEDDEDEEEWEGIDSDEEMNGT